MHEELEIVKNMSDEAGPEFQKHYENYCSKNNIDLDELNNKHNERIQKLYAKKDKTITVQEHTGSTELALSENKYDETVAQEMPASIEFTNEDDREMYEVFSKLFRKLATVLHPDKLINSNYDDEKRKEMRAMFTSAKTALEEKRYFILIDYAEKLNIPTPKNYKQQISWMKREVESVRSDIAAVTRTYNYSFAEAETEEQKDNLIRKFMNQVFGHNSIIKQQKDVDNVV